MDLSFNETELDIFKRQSGFAFKECYQTENGALCSIDSQSGQIFIGNDLLKCNLHDLSSIIEVRMGEDGTVNIVFDDSSKLQFKLVKEDAEAIVSTLQAYVPDADNAAVEEEDEEAEIDCTQDDQEVQLETYDDGTMTPSAILATVKNLKPDDRIHLEYSPLLGKLRTFDAEFRGLDVVADGRCTIYDSSDNFDDLMDKVAYDLFGSMNLHFFCHENNSEISCRLKRVTILKKIDDEI